MRALTVHQPYAELIASGQKTIENRMGPLQHRGLLAIHAGVSRDWIGDAVVFDFHIDVTALAFGAVVAIAEMYDCLHKDHLPIDLKFNIHAHGPWCYLLRGVRRLETPIPYRGKQGLWHFPDDLLTNGPNRADTLSHTERTDP